MATHPERMPAHPEPAEGNLYQGSISIMSGKTEQNLETINSSCIETAFANAFEVLCYPGEIVLLFGNIQVVDGERGDFLSANLATRIILSPFAAKRLATLINDKIHDYESVFGPLTKEVPAFSAQAKTSFRNDIAQYASEQTAEKANSLKRLTDKLDVEYDLERSFKISYRSLLMNRFIMGFKKDDLAQNPDETMISIFRQMEMPARFLDDCRGLLCQTEFVHFGFEEQHDGCLYKAYLEFKTNLKFGSDGARVTQEPFLVFLGFKWNPFDNNKGAVSRYTCYPLLSLEEIQEKLSCLFERNPDYKSFQTAKNILNKTVKIISDNKIIYEEVSEDNNPRKSFDMNLYGANLRIRDIYPFLMDIGRHYSLPDDQFIPLCNRISDKTFGHLSGGVDREGKDFLTVYYGVEGIDSRCLPHTDVAAPC